MIPKALIFASFACLTALPALGQEAASTPPAMALQFHNDADNWTGRYGGVQFGLGKADGFGPAGLGVGGVTLGYDRDFGSVVVGAGLDYDFADIAIDGAETVDNILRLKGRVGYDMGQGLPYVTAGAAYADTATLGSDTGYFLGVGYEHRLTPRVSLGGEVLWHRFDDFNDSGDDIDLTTAQMRASFRF